MHMEELYYISKNGPLICLCVSAVPARPHYACTLQVEAVLLGQRITESLRLTVELLLLVFQRMLLSIQNKNQLLCLRAKIETHATFD